MKIFESIKNFFAQSFFEKALEAITSKVQETLVKIGVPKANVEEIIARIPGAIDDADRLASSNASGWDKLKSVVGSLKQFLPKDLDAIASTALTFLVTGIRLYTMLKSYNDSKNSQS